LPATRTPGTCQLVRARTSAGYTRTARTRAPHYADLLCALLHAFWAAYAAAYAAGLRALLHYRYAPSPLQHAASLSGCIYRCLTTACAPFDHARHALHTRAPSRHTARLAELCLHFTAHTPHTPHTTHAHTAHHTTFPARASHRTHTHIHLEQTSYHYGLGVSMTYAQLRGCTRTTRTRTYTRLPPHTARTRHTRCGTIAACYHRIAGWNSSGYLFTFCLYVQFHLPLRCLLPTLHYLGSPPDAHHTRTATLLHTSPATRTPHHTTTTPLTRTTLSPHYTAPLRACDYHRFAAAFVAFADTGTVVPLPATLPRDGTA